MINCILDPSPDATLGMSEAEKSWFQQQVDLVRRKARKRGFKIQKVRNGGFRILQPDTAEILAGEAGDGIPIADAWDYIRVDRRVWPDYEVDDQDPRDVAF